MEFIPRCRYYRQRAVLVLALCVLVCSVAVTSALVATEHQPAGLQREGSSPLLSSSPPLQAPQPSVRRTLVREVEREDWYLLDGDQLIPAHQSDHHPAAPDAQRSLRAHTAARSAAPGHVNPNRQLSVEEQGGRPAVSTILAEPRRAASSLTEPKPPQQLQEQEDPDTVAAAAPPPSDVDRPMRQNHVLLHQKAHHPVRGESKAAETVKIALQSLRLVVRLVDKVEEEAEEVNGEMAIFGKAGTPRRTHGRVGGGGSDSPSVLLASPPGGQRVLQPLKRAHVQADAAAGKKTVPTRDAFGPLSKNDHEEGVAVTKTAEEAILSQSETTHVYTDAELRRRCVEANGRATEPALLRAIMEGKLRKNCLIVAADVGNEIPMNKNNAKGAVAIVSLLVSTLFLVFVSVF